MMGKASNRKKAQQAAGADVHAQIAAEAAQARAKPALALVPAENTPALHGLIQSAGDALAQRVPATFEHMGRTYYLRVALEQIHFMVFESATAPEPMAFFVSGSSEELGHTPYH